MCHKPIPRLLRWVPRVTETVMTADDFPDAILAGGEIYLLVASADALQIWDWVNYGLVDGDFDPEDEFELNELGRQSAWLRFYELEPDAVLAVNVPAQAAVDLQESRGVGSGPDWPERKGRGWS